MLALILVGILSFGRPERLALEPAPGTVVVLRVSGRTVRLLPGSVAGLRGHGAEVDLFAQRQLTSGIAVEAEGAFVLRDGAVVRRRYSGRLRVHAEAGRLVLRLETPGTPPDSRRHSSYDYCDLPHCGLITRESSADLSR